MANSVYFFVCIIFCINILSNVSNTNSANILGLFSTHSYSHLIIEAAVMKGLAAKGHNITIVTTFPSGGDDKKSVNNYNEIYLKLKNNNNVDEIMTTIMDSAEHNKFTIFAFPKLINVILQRANDSINHPDFQSIINNKNNKFDLFILGWTLSDFQIGIAAHLQCPSVLISTIQATQLLNSYVGNPTSYASVASALLSGNVKLPMTFLHRVKNFITSFAEMIILNFIDFYYQRYYYLDNFPSDRYPSYEDAKRNVSLILINHHFSQGNVRPYVPALIEIGGIQIKTTPSPLPEKIKDFLDTATEGAIFFSLGTNVKSKDISMEKLLGIIKVFSQIKQKILWKWEDGNLPGKSDNILIGKWLPQDDILAHKNTLLFISHCGISSVNEAKYHAVPILGIPIFGDQFNNLNAIVNEGWAVALPYANLNEKTFSQILNEILTNSKYRKQVQHLSNLYKDRPQTAMDTAIYWIEYVLRYNGAKHLQSPAIYLNFFQENSLDILLFFIVLIYVFIKIVKFIYSITFKKLLFKNSEGILKKQFKRKDLAQRSDGINKFYNNCFNNN